MRNQVTGSSTDGDETLKGRVVLVQAGVVQLREPKTVTQHTMEVMWGEVRRLLQGSDIRVLVADLRETGMPSAPIRARLREQLSHNRIGYVAMVLGGNSIMRTAARFVVTMILSDQETLVCDTPETARAWAASIVARG